MPATFRGARRVQTTELSAAGFIQSTKAATTMLRYGGKFELYSVTLCFPAIMLAILAIALYLREKYKKL